MQNQPAAKTISKTDKTLKVLEILLVSFAKGVFWMTIGVLMMGMQIIVLMIGGMAGGAMNQRRW